MGDETLACVECGQECAPKDMYGAKGDRRCEPCAKGIRKRMDPTRTHSLVATSTGTRKAKKQNQTLIMGGLFAVALVVAWAVSDRKPEAVPVDLGPPPTEQGSAALASPQAWFFLRQPVPPRGDVAPVGSLRSPAQLAALLPRAPAGWTVRGTSSGRGGPKQGPWAQVELERGDERLLLRLVDGAQPKEPDLEAFRRARNATCAGLAGVRHAASGAVWVRLLAHGRFWIDAQGPTPSAVDAALASLELTALQAR